MKKKSKKQVMTFSFASFFNDIGSDMVAPVWPLFVTSVLGAGTTALGFLDGLGIALVSLSSMFSGYFSDKLRKRKLFIWTGYLMSGFSRLGYSISRAWQHLVPFKMFDRIGKMRDPPRDALVSEIVPKKERGESFGFLRSMDTLGAVVGTIISYILISLIPIKDILLIAAIPSIISALLVLKFVKEKKNKKKIFKGFKPFKLNNNNTKLFFTISVLFSLTTFTYSFIILFAKEIGFTDKSIPLLYLVFTMIYALFSYYFGKLSDKIRRKPVIIISYMIFALMCAMIIFTQNTIYTIIIFVLYGLFNAAVDPVQRSFVADLSKKEVRGSVMGMFKMLNGLAAVPAGLLAGFLYNIHYTLPFLLGLTSSLFSAGLMVFVKE